MKYFWILEKLKDGSVYFYPETEEQFKVICAARNPDNERDKNLLTGNDFTNECCLDNYGPFVAVIHGEEFKL